MKKKTTVRWRNGFVLDDATEDITVTITVQDGECGIPDDPFRCAVFRGTARCIGLTMAEAKRRGLNIMKTVMDCPIAVGGGEWKLKRFKAPRKLIALLDALAANSRAEYLKVVRRDLPLTVTLTPDRETMEERRLRIAQYRLEVRNGLRDKPETSERSSRNAYGAPRGGLFNMHRTEVKK